MANPNIVSTTSVKGNTVVLANITAASPVTLITNTVSNSIYKIGTLIISNTNTTTPYDVTAQFVRSSTTYALANTVSIPPDTSLVLLSRDTSIYLNENDSIQIQASTTGQLQAICSYEEIL